jgi:hypothetical protein
MPETDHNEDKVVTGAAGPRRTEKRPDEPMGEEEKVLAGKPEANMPALLTKDVLGG